ncbi:MAG: hypothetical protein K0Q95_97 [Bacteroidota bacterium]|nr:hypothetical protein [Bacteroidota bacterium]
MSILTIGNSQTSVPGGAVSGVWDLSGSPYLIQGNIMVPDNLTLTIEPGVTVNFQGTYKLYVLGRILATGTVQDTITFTAANISTGWRGIRYENTTSTNDTSRFTYCKIQYGKATGTAPENDGGAFYFSNFSKAVISNCDITKCSSNNNGGAICCSSASPVINDNNISYNNGGYDGGAIFCTYNSNPSIKNNIISHNTTPAYGGGICCYYTSPVIINNSIIYNTAGNGGGIASDSGNPTISENNILNNTAAAHGGGIYCQVGSPVISGNSIAYNTALYGGGVMFDTGYSNFIKKLFANHISNNSSSEGAGLYLRDENTSTVISNNIITNNSVGNNGGGIYSTGSCCSIINCTVSNNSAVNGGALFCISGSDLIFKNSILWGNSATGSGSEVFLSDEASDPNFHYSDIQGGAAAFGTNNYFFTGFYTDNINSDPDFVAPSANSGNGFNGIVADWSLNSSSPVINAGDPSGNYSINDFAGNPRVSGGVIDMGALEFHTALGIPANVKSNSYSVYPNPFNSTATIQFSGSVNNAEINLYNVCGQKVRTSVVKSGSSTTLNRDDLPEGVYYLQLKQEKEITTVKLIITSN